MYELAQMCLVGYMLLAVVWFLIEMFLFDVSTRRAIWTSTVWPYLVWKVKTGRKKLPSSFYTAGKTHSEFKDRHSEESHDHQALKEQQDERDKGGDPA